MSSPRPTRFAPYKSALEALSKRTKTPLPSLIVSFAMLHELTAIVPLVALFFGARTLGVGETAVAYMRNGIMDDRSTPRSWVRETSIDLINEGEQWAARVGRRYGIFGYTKGPKINSDGLEPGTSASGQMVSHHLTSDVANAVFAYGVTKVCAL